MTTTAPPTWDMQYSITHGQKRDTQAAVLTSNKNTRDSWCLTIHLTGSTPGHSHPGRRRTLTHDCLRVCLTGATWPPCWPPTTTCRRAWSCPDARTCRRAWVSACACVGAAFFSYWGCFWLARQIVALCKWFTGKITVLLLNVNFKDRKVDLRHI